MPLMLWLCGTLGSDVARLNAKEQHEHSGEASHACHYVKDHAPALQGSRGPSQLPFCPTQHPPPTHCQIFVRHFTASAICWLQAETWARSCIGISMQTQSPQLCSGTHRQPIDAVASSIDGQVVEDYLSCTKQLSTSSKSSLNLLHDPHLECCVCNLRCKWLDGCTAHQCYRHTCQHYTICLGQTYEDRQDTAYQLLLLSGQDQMLAPFYEGSIRLRGWIEHMAAPMPGLLHSGSQMLQPACRARSMSRCTPCCKPIGRWAMNSR